MKKTPEQIVADIQEACGLLGWNIAMDESSPGVKGLVIGQGKYVEDIVNQLTDSENYSIYTSSEDVGSHLN